jgi:hypothetical protein
VYYIIIVIFIIIIIIIIIIIGVVIVIIVIIIISIIMLSYLPACGLGAEEHVVLQELAALLHAHLPAVELDVQDHAGRAPELQAQLGQARTQRLRCREQGRAQRERVRGGLREIASEGERE